MPKTRKHRRINTKKRKGKHPSSRKQNRKRKTRKMRGGNLTCNFDAEILENIDTTVGQSGILGEGKNAKAFVVLEQNDNQSLFENKKTKYVVKEIKIPKVNGRTTREKVYIKTQITKKYDNAKKEAEILQNLSINKTHPNILKYIGCINKYTKNQFYIVTEYNEGYIALSDFINNTVSSNKDGFKLTQTFTQDSIKDYANKFVSSIIQNTSAMQNEIITNCIRQLYEGLYAIHEREVFHRDIKPANIIINPLNGDIKYIDFGLSSTVKDVNENNIEFEGTPKYMPYNGVVLIDNENVDVFEVYYNNKISFNNLLIYLDYWALALVIYMLFCRNNLLNFADIYDSDEEDDPFADIYESESDDDHDDDDTEIKGGTKRGGDGKDITNCIDTLLNKFYKNEEYHPSNMTLNFKEIDDQLGPLEIPYYMNVSDILYTVEGKEYKDNLLKMYNNFMKKYDEMKTPT
jgi:serine/threonine protein kinase